jgi:hypothetical protein
MSTLKVSDVARMFSLPGVYDVLSKAKKVDLYILYDKTKVIEIQDELKMCRNRLMEAYLTKPEILAGICNDIRIGIYTDDGRYHTVLSGVVNLADLMKN